MIVVMGQFRFPVAAMAQARIAMAEMIAASRAETGCIAYEFAEDVLDPGLIRVSERWTSRAALETHFATPHMARWKDKCAAFGLSDHDVRAYKTDEGEAL